jgi:hypothetical protein
MTRAVLRAAAMLVVFANGCRPESPVPHLPPVARADTSRAGNNWPVAPDVAEALLTKEPLEFATIHATEQGVAGAMKADVVFPRTGKHLTVKWKALPAAHMDGWNNNPRKEIANYEIQRWFLDPKDYVVPTVALRCVPVAAMRVADPTAAPTIEGTGCVLGTLSLWLEHVKVPEPLYDPERFATEPWYAYHLSNFNLLAYLVEHRDGRPGNILTADVETNRRVFAVDNGISFGGLVYNFLTTNWDVIRVPAVRREAIERLRAIDRDRLDALGTLAELKADRNGVLRPGRLRAPIDPTTGVRVRPGGVQMGLTTDEIDAVADRLKALLRRVDDGNLPTF